MLGNLSGWHLLIIVFVILLLFGAPKLPALARSLGQSMKIFKKEVTEPEAKGDGTAESKAETSADSTESASASKTPADSSKE